MHPNTPDQPVKPFVGVLPGYPAVSALSTADDGRTIFTRADKPTSPLETALKFLAAGFWPVLLHPWNAPESVTDAPGKAPIGNEWGAKRPTRSTLKAAYARNPEAGVGLKLGPAGGLVDIDVDVPELADEHLARMFPDGEPTTFGWKKPNGRRHYLFLWHDRLAAFDKSIVKGYVDKKTGEVRGNPHYLGLEVRINGEDKQIQTVIPPSRSADGGNAREWNGVEAIAPFPESLLADLNAHERALPAPVAAPAPAGRIAKPMRARAGGGGWTPGERYAAWLAKVPGAVSGSNGHSQTLKAAKGGPGFDLPPDETMNILRADYNPRCEPRWSERELQHKVDEAYKVETRRGWMLDDAGRNGHSQTNGRPPGGPVAAPRQRPDVEITTERHVVVEHAIKAIADNDPDVFVRAGSLVVVVRETEDIAVLASGVKLTGSKGTPRIVPLSESAVGLALTRNANFWHWKPMPGGKGEVKARDCHPPDWLVRSVASLGYFDGIRRLVAVAGCPFVREDGSLLDASGFDAPTGTLLLPTIDIPPIAANVDQVAAQAAWARIRSHVDEFPFLDADAEAVYLAALLTCIQRPMIVGLVPGFAVIGNKAGTGKGLMIDALSLSVFGKPASVTDYPSDPIEMQKVKVATVLAGKPLVHLDNLSDGGTYGNRVLDSWLTARFIEDRILGVSRNTGDLANRAVLFVSGNNASPEKDAHRRWAQLNLFTPLERPHERSDIKVKDLHAHILEHRADILHDALTILVAHARAGRPAAGSAPLGSFEEWDRVVRGAVHFATGRDCLAGQKAAEAEAPERQEKLALLDAWRDLPLGGRPHTGHTAEKAIEAAEANPTRYAPFLSAIRRYSKDGKPTSPRNLGNVIRAMKGSVHGGMFFEENGKDHNVTIWRVAEARKPTPAVEGESGESDYSARHSPWEEKSSHDDVNTLSVGSKSTGDGVQQTSQASQTTPPVADPSPALDAAEWPTDPPF